ncbi:MAG TPA: arginine--tRNA ligase, partial [Candidatus Cloacimonadota bacterium]|nr:arginine--tRNA ligase [Candidatus Cloacimonadota bacterium]
MIKYKITNDLNECLSKLKLKSNDKFVIETQANDEFGDYSTNLAMVLAKLNKIKPYELAEKVCTELRKNKDYKAVEIAGPGFINMTMNISVLQKSLKDILDQNDSWGKSEAGTGKRILLEFVSANPTGPLNIVSARAAAFGDSLYRVMKFVGYDALREFYINDAGNQVDILAESLELRLREMHGENIGEFPFEAYHGDYVKDLAHRLNTLEGSRVLLMADRERTEHLKEFALEQIHDMQVKSLEKYGVHFDSWVSEKTLRQQGVVEEVLSYLAEADCTYEKEDAIWFCSSKFGDDKDRVLMKADGSITYFVPDLAYHLTKYQRSFDVMIDVLGPDHHGYVPRLKAAIHALNYPEDKLEIIFLQQVNLFDSGEKVKMSKRLGTIVTMDDLVDYVGTDAARYFFMDRKPNSHLNFDIDLAKRKTNENPVFYCQYAHARICSILKKAKKDKISLKELTPEMLKK